MDIFLRENNQNLILTYGDHMNRKIRALIILKFDSQGDFAQYVQHNESFVSRVLRGRVSPSAEVIQRWTEALGENVEGLFETDEQARSATESQS